MTTHRFKTTNIKGKEYVEVNQRLLYFRNEQAYAGWSLESELIDLQPDRCCIRAVIRDNEGRIRATGHASEDRTSSMVNKTSYVENCETSAWGGALANLGIGIETSIASSNEVEMAIAKRNLVDLDQRLGLASDLEGLTLDTLRADYFNLVDRMPESEQPKLRGVYGFTADKYRKGIAYMQSKLEGGDK